MKKTIDAILVVEGKSDVAFLSNYIDTTFVTTNGSDIPSETILYLKKASETKDIIVLSDPDCPGKRIRDVLDSHIPNLKHCFVRKQFAVKHGKVGVAECDIEEVFNALNNVFTNKMVHNETITINDLYSLGLIGQSNSNILRNKISEKLCLGYNNAKTFHKRINMMGISKEKLEELTHEQRAVL